NLILGMNAEMGEFFALQQAKKSLESRICRAQRGLPACGVMPFGRTYDRKTNTWGIDPAKQALIAAIARRYLTAESLPKLAAEYGWHRGNLRLTLRERCGGCWRQEFHNPRLNIHEMVETPVPRLLPEATIKAVHQRLEANRTHLHQPANAVYNYLLGGR